MDVAAIKHIHFVGIGGAGVSVLAEAFLTMGKKVTGSDAKHSPAVDRLVAKGALVSVPHSAALLPGADVLCFSSAVPETNTERIYAKEQGICEIRRGDLLALLLSAVQCVAVAGTHGKTTTTGMTAVTLKALGKDVSIMLGGSLTDAIVPVWGAETVIAETDESDGTFLKVAPEIGVITNIEAEHLSHWGDFETLKKGFTQWFMQIKRTPIVCGDDPVVAEMVYQTKRACVTYGFKPTNMLWAHEIEAFEGGMRFDAVFRNEPMGRFTLSVSGRHNVLNALAVIAVASTLGYAPEKIRMALSQFKGTKRRMEYVGESNGTVFIDDYGHHPTEIAATLSALKARFPKRKLIALFQPHRYSRVRECLEGFGRCFDDADHVFVTDIYSAHENEFFDVSVLVDEIKKRYAAKTEFCPKADLPARAAAYAKGDDCVVALGAGDITKTIRDVLYLKQAA
jgi:UDP-N-acetylmuramate--alanine ligase